LFAQRAKHHNLPNVFWTYQSEKHGNEVETGSRTNARARVDDTCALRVQSFLIATPRYDHVIYTRSRDPVEVP
jgi:hypothetical protein